MVILVVLRLHDEPLKSVSGATVGSPPNVPRHYPPASSATNGLMSPKLG